MIEYREGDLLTSEVNVVVHGCNCKKAFGSGIARTIREMFIEPYQEDQKTLWGDRNKLGTYTTADSKGYTFINAYTQYNYTTSKIDVDYDALRKVMYKIKSDIGVDRKIGMPRIGCGLASGDWNIVEDILNEVFDDRTVYIYDLKSEWFKINNKWVHKK